MKVQIRNLQKTKKIDLALIRKNIRKIFKLLSLSPGAISFVFCDKDCITRLNTQYLGKARSTDVIAFPLPGHDPQEFLGEVVVSVDAAGTNSRRFNTTFEAELTLYIIHGILHLLDYDDHTPAQRTKMRQKEQELIGKIF
ncbi:MAG: rRNA maturation RNase YbeY [Candidatus Omnitrophica bacterium]|nr:rRNA maturation RNase YbeY [Candidatus Omnitrophota bacterium]